MGVALHVPWMRSIRHAIADPETGRFRHGPDGIRGAWLRLFIGNLA
jgi:hypothetical protein